MELLKSKFLTAIGVVLSSSAVYSILTWIYVVTIFPETSQTEAQAIYLKRYLFGINPDDIGKAHFLIIACGVTAVTIFGILLNRLNKQVDKSWSNKAYFLLHLILLIIFSVFTFLNIWSIL